LVTGSNGFVGQHAVRDLRTAGHDPVCFDMVPGSAGVSEEMYTGDIRDSKTVLRVVEQVQPDACIHLAGIAFVPVGWTNPQLMFSVNVLGTLNLLEAFRHAAPTARVLVVSSAEVYGRVRGSAPFTEDIALAPTNPYGISKVAADLETLLYAERYDMPLMTARPGNHIGPGQSVDFVASAFARQLAQMANSSGNRIMRVGNLENERDFTDVRDVVRAYRLLLEHGKSGRAYNVAAGQEVKIQFLLDTLCEAAGFRPQIEVAPERYRPTDSVPELDISRLQRHTGWTPQIPLKTTLCDIYHDARQL